MPHATSPVWLITGCSTGFGRDLAKLILDRGWNAVVTARDVARVKDLAAPADRALPLALDVTDQGQIDSVVRETEARFGRIDVLVNNAGYGYQTSVEEGVESEIRAMFDANVFGLFAMTRAVLPIMRRQRSGHIVNITSLGGMIGFQGSGYYSATKHAIEGWSDALAAEGAPLGIKVICVEPGPFRTDWAGRSLKQTVTRIEDYADTVGKRMKATSENSGKQPGDPIRAGEAMIEAVLSPEAPRHLVLGAIAYNGVTAKLEERRKQIEAWKDAALGADFPKG